MPDDTYHPLPFDNDAASNYRQIACLGFAGWRNLFCDHLHFKFFYWGQSRSFRRRYWRHFLCSNCIRHRHVPGWSLPDQAREYAAQTGPCGLCIVSGPVVAPWFPPFALVCSEADIWLIYPMPLMSAFGYKRT